MSAIRDQIINFLLLSDDNKERIIADLQKQLTQLHKELEDKNNVQLSENVDTTQSINGKIKSV